MTIDPEAWHWYVITAGTEFTDADFTLTLSSEAVPGTDITLTATADVPDCDPESEYSPCTAPVPVTLTVTVVE